MKRITQLRKEKHLNQIGLGLKLNVSQKMISAYENGIHQPGIETLIQMSKLFNVSIDYIVENSDIRLPAEQIVTNNLNERESELLSIFRSLDKDNQLKAIGIVFALQKYTS